METIKQEAYLKKEFNKRDIQRIRNLVLGKVGEKTQVQAGWEKERVEHKEGDIWEENGKKWTIQNGIKVSVTKMDALKEIAIMPLFCPKCGKLMASAPYNKKMWAIHGMCLNCVVDMETKIKAKGLDEWNKYCESIVNSNKEAQLNELETALNEWYASKETYVSEAGDVEKWIGGDKKAVYEAMMKRIQELRSK